MLHTQFRLSILAVIIFILSLTSVSVGAQTDVNYTYDDLQRLTKVVRLVDGTSITYSYDANGNILSRIATVQTSITANTTGPGSGTISSNPPGINYSYPAVNTGGLTAISQGTVITVTATAAPGSTVSWNDCVPNGGTTGGTLTTATCTFNSLSSSKTVTASFATSQDIITANGAGVNGGTITSGSIINAVWNGSVTNGNNTAMINPGTGPYAIVATAHAGVNVTWSGNCDVTSGNSTGIATCTINSGVSSAKTVIATFAPNQYLVQINGAGTGSGIVTSTPREISFTYPTANSGSVHLDYGFSVSLTATALAHSAVTWTGCNSTGGSTAVATCIISSISTAKNVTATFSAPAWQSIPGAIISGPALVWNPINNNALMVVQGTGNTIWTGTLNSNGIFNNDITQIPGTILSPPSLIWNPVSNKVQMVVQGSNNTIWTSTFSENGAFNNDWTQIPGAVISPPSLVWNPVTNRAQMVVQGSSNTIWTATFSETGTFNGDWTQIPGAIISPPALSWNPVNNEAQMGVQGSGNTIWSATFNSNGIFNNNWTLINGAIGSPATLAWDPLSNNTQMVVEGSNNTIWSATFDSTGTFNNDWQLIPGSTIDRPAIVWNSLNGNFLIVVRGTNNTIWSSKY